MLFGEFDKLVDTANPFGGDNAKLRKMAAQGVDASLVRCLMSSSRILCSISAAWLSALLTGKELTHRLAA